jgi:DNA-binding GntR family transcriptional regulator
MSSAAQPLGSPSRRERVLETLRAAIVSGRLDPGDRLVETEIAEAFGTSRAPVREALRQLEQEGLVASRPYRRTEVLGVTQDEVEQVLVPIRLTIERFTFAKALPKLTAEDLAALADVVSAMKQAAEAGDVDALAEADVRFHEYVIERSDQPHCLQIWRAIEPRVRAHFRRDATRHRHAGDIADEHERLLAALRTGDERAVTETLEQHILNYLAPKAAD